MSFDHRSFWNARFVAVRLQRNELSEAAVFRYFLAVTAFDWISVANTVLLNLAMFGYIARVLRRWASDSAMPVITGLEGHNACYGKRTEVES